MALHHIKRLGSGGSSHSGGASIPSCRSGGGGIGGLRRLSSGGVLCEYQQAQVGAGFFSVRPPSSRGGVRSEAGRQVMSKAEEDAAVEAFGKELWGLFGSYVGTMWEEELRMERMVISATRLYALGLRSEHLEEIGCVNIGCVHHYLNTTLKHEPLIVKFPTPNPQPSIFQPQTSRPISYSPEF